MADTQALPKSDIPARAAYYRQGNPAGVFLSGFQETITSADHWRNKLPIWKFGIVAVQKLEEERMATPEAEFTRAYEGLVLMLLALGNGLKDEIDDPEIVEHLKANIDNLNSKYITFKAPPLNGPNRLLQSLAA